MRRWCFIDETKWNGPSWDLPFGEPGWNFSETDTRSTSGQKQPLFISNILYFCPHIYRPFQMCCDGEVSLPVSLQFGLMLQMECVHVRHFWSAMNYCDFSGKNKCCCYITLSHFRNLAFRILGQYRVMSTSLRNSGFNPERHPTVHLSMLLRSEFDFFEEILVYSTVGIG